MKTAGIICEYNPFHNGHLYQINRLRQSGVTHIIAVMSGNFVQRGDISIVPKLAKAQMALAGGADLVLELPTVWAMSSAQNFAQGGVDVLKNTGVCDALAFGSECGDLELLQSCLAALENEKVALKTEELLKEGISFVNARSKALEHLFGKQFSDIISSPNDILGLEYLKALKDTSLTPVVIQRDIEHDKNNDDPFLKSAAQIRKMILAADASFKSAVPLSTVEILREYASIGQFPNSIDDLEIPILAVLRRLNAEDIAKCPDVVEGLENRIDAAIKLSGSYSEILFRSKSKRYTLARMRRILLSAFLSIDKDLAKQEVPYLRVLAMNTKGMELLKKMQTNANKPIITKYADFDATDAFCKTIFQIESRAQDLYSLAYQKPAPCGTEMTARIIIQND